MRTRHPLLPAAIVAAGFVAATPLGAFADCSETHMSVAKTEQPVKVTEPATTATAPTPDSASLQAKAVEPSADNEQKPEVR